MAIFGVDQPACDTAAQQSLDCLSHGAAGLAGAHHVNTLDIPQTVACFAGGKNAAMKAQMTEHSFARIGRRERCAENGYGLLPELRPHINLPEQRQLKYGIHSPGRVIGFNLDAKIRVAIRLPPRMIQLLETGRLAGEWPVSALSHAPLDCFERSVQPDGDAVVFE